MTQLPTQDRPDIRQVEAPATADQAMAYVPQVTEISLRDVVIDLWWGKWIIALCTTIVVLAVIGFIHVTAPKYTARLIVAAHDSSSSDTLISQLGSVAGLLGGFNTSLFTRGEGPLIVQMEAVIPTVAFAQHLDDKYDMLHLVFAEAWDEKTQSWRPPPEPSWFGRVWRGFLEFVHIPGWRPPDNRMLATYLNALNFEESASTGITEITFSHRDPEFALKILSLVFYEADDYLRSAEQARVSSRIDYLRSKLEQIRMLEYRQALLSLISLEEKKMMLLEAGDTYVGKLLEPPVVSANPTSPPSGLLLWGSIVLGLIIGCFVALFWRAMRRA